MDRVNAPARSEKPHPSVFTKKSIPNRPYTMEGIPESVSVVRRMTSTNLLPLPAYSTRKIAEKIPKGMAMIRESSVMITVLMRAGTTDAFSEEYSSENRDGVMWGSPFTRMYTIRKISTAKVMTAASITRRNTTKEPGCFR